MKLFGKYNRISIAISITVFVAGCAAFYFIMWYVLIRQLDGALHTEQTEITTYVKTHDRLPEIMNAYNQQISFAPVTDLVKTPVYASVKTWNDQKKEMEWRRELEFGIQAGGQNYRVTVSKSQMETEDLLELVILVGAVMIAVILVLGYAFNRLLIKKLWKPFYSTVHEVEHYSLASQKPLQLPSSRIHEFDLLNRQLTEMTERAGQDYRLIKEFSINAAHEMQTPLAVIRASIENLIQDEQLLKQHNRSIQTIEFSVDRLNRLNQALLLLTKIENGQFELTDKVAVDQVVNEKIAELAELFEGKNLTVKQSIRPQTITGNRFLVEIIVQNLLNNAIRYNQVSGIVEVVLEPGLLTIANTSALPELDPEKIGHRFYRHPESKTEGNGLGLSIVKEICQLSGFDLQYDYRQKLHVFTVRFGNGPGRNNR